MASPLVFVPFRRQASKPLSNFSSHLVLSFLETLQGVYFQISPPIASPPWVILSHRREKESLETYAYFLLFLEVKKRSLRYGCYVRVLNGLLELKWTLYTHPEYPLHLTLKLDGEERASQLLFQTVNFNYFLSWEECKKSKNLTIHFSLPKAKEFSWSIPIQFRNILLV